MFGKLANTEMRTRTMMSVALLSPNMGTTNTLVS